MFYLKKHYFDCIDHDGNAIIFYAAEMKIMGIKIPYSSYILSNSNEVIENNVLQASKIHDNKIQNEKLDIKGSWVTLDQPIQEKLLEENSKYLKWNCHSPKADVKLSLGEKNYHSFGYAETLEMNFVPWHLPISELKWGRFLSENNTIIWIEWIGKHPLKKVYWNGQEVEDVIITDDGLEFINKQSVLKFGKPTIIKNEQLFSMTKSLPFLRLFFGKKFLKSREIKFKSQSTLIKQNQSEQGFSLYEKVLWEI